MRRAIFCFAAAIVFSGHAQAADRTWADALGSQIADGYDGEPHRQFDFWIGEWEMNWRPRVDGQFEHAEEGSWTRQRVFPILGGKAIVELAWARDNPEEASQRGFSIRYFNAAHGKWVMAQNWPNAQATGSGFTDQLMGGEHHGRMTVYSQTYRPLPDGEFADEHRRYNFSDIRPGESFRWDGSNSPDRGRTWSTWYVVDAHRKRDLVAFGPAGSDFSGVHEKKLCTEEPHGAFDGLRGSWRGEAEKADGTKSEARFDGGLVLDGCGIAGVFEADGARTFVALGYQERFGRWVQMTLNDRPGEGHAYYVGAQGGAGAALAASPALSIENEFDAYIGDNAFSGEGGLERYVWDEIGDNELRFRREIRPQPGAAWRTEETWRLHPAP